MTEFLQLFAPKNGGKFPLARFLWISLILTLFTAVTVVEGGFYGGNCPPKAAMLANISLSCQVDCRIGHNALYGHCGEYEDFNCYCTQPMTTPSPRPLQCVDETNYLYEDLCRIDCLCNHAATYWRCNYDTHACECSGQNLDPENNEPCPYECLRDMVIDLNAFKLPGVKFNVPKECNVKRIPICQIPF